MLDLAKVTSDRFFRLAQEGIWITLGQAMAVLGTLFGVRLLTELLDPIAYGELALGLTVATLVNQVILGPLGNGAARFYAPAVELDDLGGYLSALQRSGFAATLVIVLLILVANIGLMIIGYAEWIPMTIMAFIFAIVGGYGAIIGGIQNAARQRVIVALHQGMESWARFLVAAGMLLWMGATSTVAMFGYATAVTLVLTSQLITFKKSTIQGQGVSVINSNDWQMRIWKYSWPFAIFGIFTWAQLVSDRWALGLFTTTQEVGFYAVLYQLGYYPMSIAAGMVQQFVGPIIFQRAGDASDSRRNAHVYKISWNLSCVVLLLTCVAFVAALLFHATLFRYLVAGEYSPVSYLLPWMLLAGGLFAAGQTTALNLMSLMRPHRMLAAKIVTALLGIVFNVMGAYWYDLQGVVVAAVLFSAIYFLWMAGLSKHEVGKSLL
ncbi:MAG: hypothetical protein FD165_712 [Gammaproteobacteria bacterium]|nr:MAG: hypothetical protein FD165_712 [Gammaproteobacteria bacterium]TND07039.1 MAG: hypothetical protein FD120_207 [Gammaproteobacteria bacterium]